MADRWIGYAAPGSEGDLAEALAAVAPFSVLTLASSAQDLRSRARQSEPGTVGVVVGLTEEGVSDINLAAAVAGDGIARQVVLVATRASGSLRSRARRAGVSQVVDLSELRAPAPSSPVSHPSAEDRPVAGPEGAGERGAAPHPSGGPGAGEKRPARGGSPAGRAAGGRTMDASEERAGAQSAPPPASAAGDVRAAGRSPVLVLASGRGGVGKTALAALCAATAASWGMRVALVDLDLSCGNLAASFAVPKTFDLAQLAGRASVSDDDLAHACVPCAEGVHLWGPCTRPEAAELVAPLVPRLLDLLARTHDLVVVDTSTTFTEAVGLALQRCDRLLLVHDHAAGAIASLGRASAPAVRLGVARTRVVRVENFAAEGAQANLEAGRALAGLEGALAFAVPDGGADVEALLGEGKVAQVVAAGGLLPEGVAHLMAHELSELGALPNSEAAHAALEASHPKRRRGLFGRRKAS